MEFLAPVFSLSVLFLTSCLSVCLVCSWLFVVLRRHCDDGSLCSYRARFQFVRASTPIQFLSFFVRASFFPRKTECNARWARVSDTSIHFDGYPMTIVIRLHISIVGARFSLENQTFQYWILLAFQNLHPFVRPGVHSRTYTPCVPRKLFNSQVWSGISISTQN